MLPAAVVTHHPDPAWPSRLAAVLREHPRMVVVDNSISPASQQFVSETLSGKCGVTLLSRPDNPGIGTALNLAFALLAAEGHPRVVAYDQDSTPAPGFAAALSATSTAFPCAAVIGANWTDPRRPGQTARFLRAAAPFHLGFCRTPAATDLADLLCVITSGSLFQLQPWQALQGFREDLFLDLVDTDYCLRTRRAGHDIAASAAAVLEHHRGEKQPARLLGRDFYPSHTPLFRLHCLSRNRVLLFRSHRLRPVAWVLYELAYAGKLVADTLLFEPNKLARVSAMIDGTLDGLLAPHGQSAHLPNDFPANI